MKVNLHHVLICVILAFYLYPAVIQEPHYGTYKYSKHKRTINRSFVKGRIIDKETGEPLKIAALKVNDRIVNTDTNGHFLHEVAPGKYVFTGVCYPYHGVETKPIKISKGESITITFYLLMDKRPIND